MLEYVETDWVYDWIMDRAKIDIPRRSRILGQSPVLDPIIWVVNFAIYKAHLQWCEGIAIELLESVEHKCVQYLDVFPILMKVVKGE